MNISEAVKITGLTAATLRYYESEGLIPPVNRKNGGVRDYQKDDLGWIDFIKCMRSAGMSVESLIEYTTLFRNGTESDEARNNILIRERDQLLVIMPAKSAYINVPRARTDHGDVLIDFFD